MVRMEEMDYPVDIDFEDITQKVVRYGLYLAAAFQIICVMVCTLMLDSSEEINTLPPASRGDSEDESSEQSTPQNTPRRPHHRTRKQEKKKRR